MTKFKRFARGAYHYALPTALLLGNKLQYYCMFLNSLSEKIEASSRKVFKQVHE